MGWVVHTTRGLLIHSCSVRVSGVEMLPGSPDLRLINSLFHAPQRCKIRPFPTH
jgi:hypothetical protein